MKTNWNQFEEILLTRNVSEKRDQVVSLDRQLPMTELRDRFVQCFHSGDYITIISYFDGSMLEHQSLVESIQTEDDLFLAIKSFMLCYLEDDSEETEEKNLPWRVFELLFLGIAYFELYCLVNYTGPELTRKERDVLDVKTEEESKTALFMLECDGNFAHHTVDMPHLLLFSRIILSLLANPTRSSWKNGIRLNEQGEVIPPTLAIHDQFRSELIEAFHTFSSLQWWNVRSAVFHARLLLNQSYEVLPTLWNEVTLGFRSVLQFYGGSQHNQPQPSDPSIDLEKVGSWTRTERMLASKVWLEWGLACHYFSYGDKGKKYFTQAREIAQLEVYLTAALGKRTKYQREDIAQLLLYAKSGFAEDSTLATTQPVNTTKETTVSQQLKQPEGDEPPSEEFELGRRVIQETVTGEEVVTREVLLDQVNTGAAENIILEGGPKFQQPESVNQGSPLLPLDQAIILALCLDVSNHNPVDGLTNEEMLPYIERVLQQPLNWMIHSTALLERSWLEFERRKTADRAMLQIQALIDQHSTKLTITQASYQAIEESAKGYERLAYLYQIVYPSQFELKKDLARKYLQCQVFQSALNYFRELQMWDEVIVCYQFMNKPQRAEIIVREQLKQTGETPYMITALADLTGREELYEQAWALSQGRYPRAKRTLAKICYDREDYLACIQHLTQALAVQPLVHTAWYLKGIACMRAEQWEEGKLAFVRCVQLESEVGEAWTNLGAIYMRQKEWHRAYPALIEAKKHKTNDYRVLENLLTTTLALEKWKEGIQLMNQLIDLRFKSQQPIHYAELHYLAKLLPSLQQDHVAKKEHLFDELVDGAAERHDIDLEKEKTKIQTEYELHTHRLQSLIDDFEKLLQKIVLVLRSDPKVNDIIADFYQGLVKNRLVYEYRVKQVRAIINEAGWERKEEQVNMLGVACEKLKESLQKPEIKKEDIFAARMLIQSCLRKLNRDEVFTAAVESKLNEIISQIEG